ncbi:hypothetical protein Fot_42730 [Forsythia ovata]|uniref:Uncharacterized protein n=1 Tax=Forsythia ovata TaxID=205694 RepID=A0ABD1RM12_9LAMI
MGNGSPNGNSIDTFRASIFKSSKSSSWKKAHNPVNIELENPASPLSALPTPLHDESFCLFGPHQGPSTPTPRLGKLFIFPLFTKISLAPPTPPPDPSTSPVNSATLQPQVPGFSNRKFSHTVRDLASDLRDFSFLIWTFRANLDCSSSNAFNLLAVFDFKAEFCKPRRE